MSDQKSSVSIVNLQPQQEGRDAIMTIVPASGRTKVGLSIRSCGDIEFLSSAESTRALLAALKNAQAVVADWQEKPGVGSEEDSEHAVVGTVGLTEIDTGDDAQGVVSVSPRGIGLCLGSPEEGSLEVWLSAADARNVVEALRRVIEEKA